MPLSLFRDEVVVALGGLGDALSQWAKAATDSPENRRHLDEIRTSVNDMARNAGQPVFGLFEITPVALIIAAVGAAIGLEGSLDEHGRFSDSAWVATIAVLFVAVAAIISSFLSVVATLLAFDSLHRSSADSAELPWDARS